MKTELARWFASVFTEGDSTRRDANAHAVAVAAPDLPVYLPASLRSTMSPVARRAEVQIGGTLAVSDSIDETTTMTTRYQVSQLRDSTVHATRVVLNHAVSGQNAAKAECHKRQNIK